MATEGSPKRQQAERRTLVADLARTQATLQARSEQLEAIFASRWYRLGRLLWGLRRGKLRRAATRPRMAEEGSTARPLDEATAVRDRAARPAGEPMPGLEEPRREGVVATGTASRGRERLLVAGHSLSFSTWIAARAGRGGFTVREERWRSHAGHDEAAGAAALAWADVVLCEWCLGNAVWFSRNKRPGQRLVVRFHRMELETAYPGEVELEQVDAMVFVARHVLEEACGRFGWDPGDPRFEVLPNGIDPGPLRQEKQPGAELTLGVIGYVPRLKRLDRALDVLEALRGRDERWRLLAKGREPWEHPQISASSEERDFYETLRRRLQRGALRDAVGLEPFGDDVPGFLRKVGWILSTSDVEGHSVALAEGMASAATPVVLERPGAREQYEERWVHADPEAAAEAILELQRRGEAIGEGEAARRFAERWDRERLWPEWERLLLGKT